MDAVVTWVKQLVLVVLLAALAEMLLPQAGMRRYANAALGLLVLLAVLVPFLGLVRRGVDWEAALRGLPEPAPGSLEPSVARLREASGRLTVRAYRARVEQEVARVAEGVEGVARAEARAEVDEDPLSPRFGTVRDVTVTVFPGPRQDGSGIAPVRPVEIDPGGPPGPAPPEAGPAGAPPALAPEEAGRLQERVRTAVSREFGLGRDRVRVIVGRREPR